MIYLRMPRSAAKSAHAELGRVLAAYSEPDLLSAFVVVEPGSHRVRRPAG